VNYAILKAKTSVCSKKDMTILLTHYLLLVSMAEAMKGEWYNITCSKLNIRKVELKVKIKK
jgi:hypothetical protein